VRTLYFNGQVVTADDALPKAEAFVTEAGRFLAVGSAADLSGLVRPGDQQINLGGQTVVPGLIDAHVHFAWFSFGLTDVNLDGVCTLEAAVELARERAAATPVGTWIRGFGFNPNEWSRWPTRWDLDAVVPDHPIVFSAKDGHSIWVNTEAIRRAGLTGNTPVPPGGQIHRDEHGEPTGILQENANDLIWSAVPNRTRQQYLEAIRQGLAEANRAGVTGVHDMDPVECFHSIQRLAAGDELTVRFFKQIPETALDAAIRAGLTTGFGNEWVRLGCLKLFSDGSLGSQTAHMLEPFNGRPGFLGVPTHTPEQLDRLIGLAVDHDIAVAVHAIGDAANRTVLDAFAKVAVESRRKALRHRIEHAQLLSDHDLPRFGELGVIASAQPSHAPSDRYTADRFWGDRCRLAYPFGTLLRAGARLAFGSDVPVEPLDPLAGIHAAVWRKRLHEPMSEPWYPAERLTVAQALHGFTLGAAYASGEERLKGSIAAGKLADFVVLTRDIMSGDEEALRTVRPQATVVGGRKVFGDF